MSQTKDQHSSKRFQRFASVMCAALFFTMFGASTAYAAEPDWDVPKTAFGDPDLQGVWTNATITALQRPEQFDQWVFGGAARMTTASRGRKWFDSQQALQIDAIDRPGAVASR